MKLLDFPKTITKENWIQYPNSFMADFISAPLPWMKPTNNHSKFIVSRREPSEFRIQSENDIVLGERFDYTLDTEFGKFNLIGILPFEHDLKTDIFTCSVDFIQEV